MKPFLIPGARTALYSIINAGHCTRMELLWGDHCKCYFTELSVKWSNNYKLGYCENDASLKRAN